MKRGCFILFAGLVACNAGDSGDRETAAGSGSLGSFDDGGSDSADGSGGDSAEGGSADGDSADGGDSAEGGSGLVKFDTAAPDGDATCQGGSEGGGGGGGAATFSYIWVANSSQSTISKINTQTMIEEGRYVTRPDTAGNPSRTSVNLNGNMAVANRAGGITAFWANPDDCDPNTNGMPGLQTATDANFLAYGEDDCLRWHTPINASSNRPAAWAPGDWSNTECRYVNNKFWTAARGGDDPGTRIMLLDGDTGVIEQTIPIPEFTNITYGGAVDGEGNFWGHQSGGSQLVFVDRQTFQYQIYTGGSGYGIAVDDNGKPWLCSGSVYRLDPVTGMWDTANVGSSIGGCMSDGQGTMWLSHDPLLGVDINTMQVVQSWDLPQDIHGVSIDFDGYVWGVPINGSQAFRTDPATGNVDTFSGLVSAYTYSDMTGFALANAGTPSG